MLLHVNQFFILVQRAAALGTRPGALPPAPALVPQYAPAAADLHPSNSPPPSYFATFSFDPVRDAEPRSLSAVPFINDSPPRPGKSPSFERLQAFELGDSAATARSNSGVFPRQPSDPLPSTAGIAEMSLDDDYDPPVAVRGRARSGSLDDLVRRR